MCKRVNDLMKDSEETLGHMDVCLGKTLFEVVMTQTLEKVETNYLNYFLTRK